MAFSKLILLFWVLLSCFLFISSSATPFSLYRRPSSNDSHLPGIELPTHLSFNSVTASSNSDCNHHLSTASSDRSTTEKNSDDDEDEAAAAAAPAPSPSPSSLKLHLKHRSSAERSRKDSFSESTHKDLTRIQTLFRRIAEMKKKKNTPTQFTTDPHAIVAELGKKAAAVAASTHPELAGQLEANLKSGVTLGSGEYFMDVFIGTPPKHFSLILDTGSDLNWIQCLPCHDCFEQHGPIYDPKLSSSYRDVSCDDSRCHLVSSPDPPHPCRSNEPCPYFYWYGDRSNTTGDLALETFTVNLTAPDGTGPKSHQVEEVIFGCGHWNRGLFHGAAGLLGLGRGPLSFASQLRSLYGHTFSYCLVDRNSNLSVSSKLIFGEDQSLISHPNLNYTSFVAGKENPTDTFYYVQMKGIKVGGELLQIPGETWELTKDGAGGTIIDSGTTLTYFADPAYQVIREAFVKKVKYPLVEGFPVLNPCYNVSGVEKVELPEFTMVFGDGAVWDFPVENYFIRLEPEEIMCLAILGTPKSSLSIIGNYQQQNFHIMYDTKKSRLGFVPMRCAEV